MAAAVCPMCHDENRASATYCDGCGYEFGQSIDKLHGLLKKQLATNRVMFWVFVTGWLGSLALAVGMATRGLFVFSSGPFVFFAWMAVRARQKIGITKHSLQLVSAKQLPKATLRSG